MRKRLHLTMMRKTCFCCQEWFHPNVFGLLLYLADLPGFWKTSSPTHPPPKIIGLCAIFGGHPKSLGFWCPIPSTRKVLVDLMKFRVSGLPHPRHHHITQTWTLLWTNALKSGLTQIISAGLVEQKEKRPLSCVVTQLHHGRSLRFVQQLENFAEASIFVTTNAQEKVALLTEMELQSQANQTAVILDLFACPRMHESVPCLFRSGFRKFVEDQRKILGSKYPFLSANQLQKRASDMWGQLTRGEKDALSMW